MERLGGNGENSTDIVYGIHAVEEALRAGVRPFQRIVLVRGDRQFSRIVQWAKEKQIPLIFETYQRLDRFVLHGRHQGVVGIVAAKAYTNEEDILAYARSQKDPVLLVIVDGVEDPQNLGAILRTAEAAGVHGIFIPERRSVGLTAGVAKASAGAIEHMRVARVSNIGKLIQRLQEQGIPAYACDPRGEKPYTTLNLTGSMALVFGVEGRGIRQGVLAKCQERATIPMMGQVESLNLSATAAVVLFEVRRQRAQCVG